MADTVQSMIDPTISPFVTALQNNLKATRDTAIKTNDVNRDNYFQQAMESANNNGLLFSTFPERMKIQYVGGTYVPNQLKIDQGYQTGISDLRNTGADIMNKIQSYQQAIDEMNAV